MLWEQRSLKFGMESTIEELLFCKPQSNYQIAWCVSNTCKTSRFVPSAIHNFHACICCITWWRHHIETLSASLVPCVRRNHGFCWFHQTKILNDRDLMIFYISNYLVATGNLNGDVILKQIFITVAIMKTSCANSDDIFIRRKSLMQLMTICCMIMHFTTVFGKRQFMRRLLLRLTERLADRYKTRPREMFNSLRLCDGYMRQ